MECAICLSKVNKVNRKIDCYHCHQPSCKKCIKAWLNERNKTTCPSCNKEWNMEFVYSNLGVGFVSHLTKIQKKILLEQEKSFLPETQIFLTIEKDFITNREKFIYYNNLYNDSKVTDFKKLKEKYLSLDIFQNQKFTKTKLLEHLNTTRNHYYDIYLSYYRAYIHGDITFLERLNLSEQLKNNKPVCACIEPNCKGYIESKTFTCGVCKVVVCKNCLEKLDPENHVCNPETVTTVKYIEKETKPCPKCCSRISKIDGCYSRFTLIPLFDGILKYSYEIQVGDKLIGDDFQPRTVQTVVTGKDNMYNIYQDYGITYTVNSKHSLALYSRGNFTTLTVDQYLTLKDSNQTLLGYKAHINFYQTTPIKVEHIGMGDYYGFMIDGNHRFILSDGTVVRNCDQMYCIQCNTAFSWKTNQIETGRIHNPHYYEQLRKKNVIIPREQETDGFCDNIDEELLSQMSNDVIIRFGRITSYLIIIDVFIDIYTTYLHNLQMTTLYGNLNYDFKSNYIERIQFLKNKIDEGTFIKRCYTKFKDINHKKDVITEIQSFNHIVKIIVIDIIKLLMIIHENFENNTIKTESFEKIQEYFQLYADIKSKCKMNTLHIDNAYNLFKFSKMFRI